MEQEQFPELGRHARSIVDAARHEDDPSADDVARLRGRVFAHLGIGLAAGATATLAATTTVEAAATTATTTLAASGGAAMTTSTVAGAAASVGLLAKMSLATKLVVALAMAGTVTTGVVVAERAMTTTPAAEVSGAPLPGGASPARTAARSEATPAAPDVEAPQPLAAPPATPPGDDPAALPGVAARPAAGPLPATASPAEGSSPVVDPGGPAVDPLAEETELLGRAQAAMAAGRSADALVLLDEHARRFPRGVLAHEREGARWLASCASGRSDEVRPAVAAFLAANPASPLAARLRAACGVAP